MKRENIKKLKRWVIKLGSSLLTGENGLNKQAISQIVDQIVELKQQGIEVILVSSGAVADGMMRLGWATRPRALYELQAAAAVGQMGLVQAYESCFQRHGMHTAQILLTHDDLSNRKRYLNARSTVRTLLGLGVVPVINENDTVSFEEMRFGDNDTLAALVANLIEAELLVILTDQAGLFDKDPRTNDDAQLISESVAGNPDLESIAGDTPGRLGRGGMLTKIKAAALAARSGTSTVIAAGENQGVLTKIFQGEPVGTLLTASQVLMAARKRWLAGHLQIRGKLIVDAGAAKVLRESGRSLLPVGVTSVEGQFNRGELVVCVDQQGIEIARGLVNYNAEEAKQVVGQSSDKIEEILGYVDEPELIHRDNLVLV
ncbi:MAG: glutamate 5-kinase [Gammaproteobacteria bacterium]|nr:glutamate 5-kinase [Gammaproteobacteria bacterium]